MTNKREDFNPCPVCGGTPRMNECRFARDSEYMEIQCMKCGLTLKYDVDVVYPLHGSRIIYAPNITWSYMGNDYKTVAEVWNAGVTL